MEVLEIEQSKDELCSNILKALKDLKA